MKIIHRMSIDLSLRRALPPVPAMENETVTRAVEIALFENGVAWDVPDDTTVAVAFRKPDGTCGLYDTLPTEEPAAEITANRVTITLAPQVLTTPGKVEISIVFLDTGLDRLATFPFLIIVEADPSAGAVASTDFYKVQNLDDLNTYLNETEDELRRYIDSIVIGGGGLPQPEEALSDTFLKITEVEDGKVTAVTGVSVEELAQLVLEAIPDGDEVSY